MCDNEISLNKIVDARQLLAKAIDDKYVAQIDSINCQLNELKQPESFGTQFVKNCSRDIAGEIVRNFFDTSDFSITADQIAMRIVNFNYDNEYDPLGDNSEGRKNIIGLNKLGGEVLTQLTHQLHLDGYREWREKNPSGIDEVTKEAELYKQKLFEKKKNENGKTVYVDQRVIEKGKREYTDKARKPDGSLYDEYTGEKGGSYKTKTGERRDVEVDHSLPLATATYNEKYIREDKVRKLKEAYNSESNFAFMNKTANSVKGGDRVCLVDGKVVAKSPHEKSYDPTTDITDKATTKQRVAAIVNNWENASENTKQTLKDRGYLNEDGKVPASVRQELKENINGAQAAVNMATMEAADYKEITKDAAKKQFEKSRMLKAVGGQLLYYALPPIIYETRCIVEKKKITLEMALKDLKDAFTRVGKYVFSKLKNIFMYFGENMLKGFITTFMDILISMVTSAVKKLFKLAKNLVVSTIDAVKISMSKESSRAQKADAVFRLMGITVTNVIIEILFEMIEAGFKIPEWLLSPLQIVVSVLCTNFVMLVLQKMDLFDVEKGFYRNRIAEIFENSRRIYEADVDSLILENDEYVEKLLTLAKQECKEIAVKLSTINLHKESAREYLECVAKMFNCDIDFEAEWRRFLGEELYGEHSIA